MKRKPVKKRSLVFAIAMLLISAITLTSSTFAWFSMGPKAEIQAMDLTVSSPDGIQISANATTWDAYLSVGEIFDNLENVNGVTDRAAFAAYSGNHNLYPTELKPVSSAFNAADGNGYANFYAVALGSTTGNATLTNQAVATDDASATQVGFVAFDLFLKSGKAQTVYFDESTFVNKEGSEDLKSTTALRVAFQNMGNAAITASAQEAIAISGLGTTTMYEPNAEERSTDAAAVGNGTGTQTTQYVTAAGSDIAMDTTNKVLTASVGATQATAINNSAADESKTFDVPAGITKLRVYIWVEGNDIDCRDSIGTDQLTAALVFSTEAPGSRTV